MPENLVPIRSILPKTVLVYIYDDGDDSIDLGDGRRLITGINDTMFQSVHNPVDGKHVGIRGRWAIIVATKEDTPAEFQPGTKVFCDEMKWARGFCFDDTLRKVNTIPYEDIILIDEDGFTNEEASKIAEWLARGDDELVEASSTEKVHPLQGSH